MICVLGERATTFDELRGIPFHRPANAGEYWMGIRHHELVSTILDEAGMRGWRVGEMKFCLSNDGADMAGAMSLTIPKMEIPSGQDLSLGIVTSNARRRSLKLVVGTTVRVCSNGMATREVCLQKKHTQGLNLSESIRAGLMVYETEARSIVPMVYGLKNRELTGKESEHILMEAGRLELMPWSRIGRVDHEYHYPRFAEFKGQNSWSLMNAFTLIVKENPPLEQLNQINRFRQLLPTVDVALIR